MLYVSNKGGGDTTGGIAHLSAVCNNRNHKKQSINEYQSSASTTGWVSQFGNHTYTVKLGIKELLNKEQIGFKELFTDYQLFYTINLLLNKELLPI